MQKLHDKPGLFDTYDNQDAKGALAAVWVSKRA
jgi:hypothetical protein